MTKLHTTHYQQPDHRSVRETSQFGGVRPFSHSIHLHDLLLTAELVLNNKFSTFVTTVLAFTENTVIGIYTGRWWVGCYIWYSEQGPPGCGLIYITLKVLVWILCLMLGNQHWLQLEKIVIKQLPDGGNNILCACTTLKQTTLYT